MPSGRPFASRVFLGAGLYGLAVMLPCYAFADRVVPAANAPAHVVYYAFVSLVVAFQMLFLLIATDPLRYRLCMIPAMMDKIAFAVPALIFQAMRSGVEALLPFAIIDVMLLELFAIAFWKTGRG